jgi:uncharacterized delta-60 repeat protein
MEIYKHYRTNRVGRLVGTARCILLITALFFTYIMPTAAQAAAAGDLDPSFGSGGKVLTDFFANLDQAYAVAIQGDGKIVAIGLSAPGANSALARYNIDGTLDTTFGTGGKVTTDFGGDDAIYAVAIQSDHKIVVAGVATNFALARYNSDGTLDTTFGTGGKVTTVFSSGPSEAHALAIYSTGKILVAGFVRNSNGGDFALARYNSGGTLDTSFGSSGNGKVTTDFFGGFDAAFALTVQADNKFVLAGEAYTGSGYDFALARYNTNGTLDSGFGAGGKVTTDFGGLNDQATAVAIQWDGKIVAAGIGPNVYALARYNSNGTLDATFGSGGKATTDVGGLALAIQWDGKIVTAGDAPGGFGLARYNSNGTLDATFGTGGKVATPVGSTYGSGGAYGVSIQGDGKIVAAGYSFNTNGNTDFTLIRYFGASCP